MFNKVILIGRLARDPELRHTRAGQAVASFTVAVDRPGTQDGQHQADFVPVTVWAAQAEACAQYLGKGHQVAVEGRLESHEWTDQQGQKHRDWRVVAQHVEFLARPRSQQNDQEPAPDSEDGMPF